MLDNLKAGDTIDADGTIEELKNACESALPKIKNMIKEEEDEEKVEELAEVRSIIKGVVLKYQDIKHGHYDTTYDISGKFKSEANSINMPPPAISLIDLDDINESSSSPDFTNTTTQKNALDELSDVFGEKADITSNTTTSADPFDLLSRSIKANTLPPSSPNLSRASSPSAHNQDIKKTSK
jgi:ADP-ribosylation factor-binding protein GGA